MSVLVLGASGATGRLLVEQLLQRGEKVKAVVRSSAKLPETLLDHNCLSVVEKSISDLDDTEMTQIVSGCYAVASCLGHNISFKGIYGHPRRLVTDATRRLCSAIKANQADETVKFVLMNTAGNSNRDLDEPLSFAEKCVIAVIRLLVPPHADNEKAADYLRVGIGQEDRSVEWVAVRPDTLINQEQVTAYKVYPSPIRSAIFNAGSTGRINVAHFMTDLITDDEIWNRWKGQMPVIYNQASLNELKREN